MSARRHDSAAFGWRALAGLVAREQRFALRVARWPGGAFAYEFVRFGVKQAWACLFGGAMLALLLATHRWHPAHAWCCATTSSRSPPCWCRR